VKGGFFLKKKPLECAPSVYTNSENASTPLLHPFARFLSPTSSARRRHPVGYHEEVGVRLDYDPFPGLFLCASSHLLRFRSSKPDTRAGPDRRGESGCLGREPRDQGVPED
jgi:hypothetical protein